jgi:hypothetical protein
MSSVPGVMLSKWPQLKGQLRLRLKSVSSGLTSKTSPICSLSTKQDLIHHDMKKTLAVSLLIPFALVCSCQKQDSTAEQQLAQRKSELDAREKALDEREKALAARGRLVPKPRLAPVPRPRPAEPRRTIPPDLQGLIPDPSQLRTEREQRMQERLAERQRKIQEQAASPTPSPTPE